MFRLKNMLTDWKERRKQDYPCDTLDVNRKHGISKGNIKLLTINFSPTNVLLIPYEVLG